MDAQIAELIEDLDTAKKSQKKAEELEKKATTNDQKKNVKNIQERINKTIQLKTKEIDRLERLKKYPEIDARIAKDKAELKLMKTCDFLKNTGARCFGIRLFLLRGTPILLRGYTGKSNFYGDGDYGIYKKQGVEEYMYNHEFKFKKKSFKGLNEVFHFGDTNKFKEALEKLTGKGLPTDEQWVKYILSDSSDRMTLLQFVLYFGVTLRKNYLKILEIPQFFAYDIQLYWFYRIKGNVIKGKSFNGCNAVHIAVMYERFEYMKTLLQKADGDFFPNDKKYRTKPKDTDFDKRRLILLFNQDTIQAETEYKGFNVLDIAYGTIHNDKLIINEEKDIDDQISNIKTTLQMLLLLHNNGCYFSNYKTRQETWTTLVSLLNERKGLKEKKESAWLSKTKKRIETQIHEKEKEITETLTTFKANHSEDTNLLISYRQTFQNNQVKMYYQEIKPLYLKF